MTINRNSTELQHQIDAVFERYRAAQTLNSFDTEVTSWGSSTTVTVAPEQIEAFYGAADSLSLEYREVSAVRFSDDDFEFEIDGDIYEQISAALDPLDITVLTDADGEKTYCCLQFVTGGPTVWAERGPNDPHFVVKASWGSDREEAEDVNDLLAGYWDDRIADTAAHIVESRG